MDSLLNQEAEISWVFYNLETVQILVVSNFVVAI